MNAARFILLLVFGFLGGCFGFLIEPRFGFLCGSVAGVLASVLVEQWCCLVRRWFVGLIASGVREGTKR